MKGVMIEKTGGVEVLRYRTDLPIPQPKKDEVLVRVDVAGINYIDTYFRTGLYSSPKPEVLGREGAGSIAAAPSASVAKQYPALKEGAHVVGICTAFYAEYAALPAASVFPVPDGVSLETAAASYLQGLTALSLINEAYNVQPGDWIFVPAAAGGVGGLLCQLLKARGAHTIAAASTPEKRDLALKLGADVAVGYEDVLDEVKKRTGGKGVPAVLDGVGKATWELSLQAIARKGTMVSFGNASGAVEPISLQVLAPKNIKLCRPTLYNYLVEREEKEWYVSELWKVVTAGKLEVPIHKVYPLADVAQAHLDIEGRKTTGKLLLKP